MECSALISTQCDRHLLSSISLQNNAYALTIFSFYQMLTIREDTQLWEVLLDIASAAPLSQNSPEFESCKLERPDTFSINIFTLFLKNGWAWSLVQARLNFHPNASSSKAVKLPRFWDALLPAPILLTCFNKMRR